MRISFHYHQIVVILLILKINRIFGTGQIYTTSNKNQYYLDGEQKYTWFDAVGKCLKMNMTLVSIETEVKSQEINTLVKAAFQKSVRLWVGGVMTSNGDKHEYIWIQTGQPFNYTDWQGINPDFYGTDEYCIEIGYGDNMEWNDYFCKSKHGFICEYPQHQTKNNAEVQQINQKLQFNLQDMQSKYPDLTLKLKDKKLIRMQEETRDNLQQKLNSQKELKQQHPKLLQQAKENEAKKLQLLTENLEAAIKEKQILQSVVLQQEHELKDQLKNLTEFILNKQKEFSETEEKVEQELQQFEYEENQQNSKINKQFRDFVFHLNQNTYYLSDAKITVNRNK